MFSTTVIWPQANGQNPNSEQSVALDDFADSLSPQIPSELTSNPSDDGSEIIAIRTWPTREIAQAWVDHVLSNYNVTSAVINE